MKTYVHSAAVLFLATCLAFGLLLVKPAQASHFRPVNPNLPDQTCSWIDTAMTCSP